MKNYYDLHREIKCLQCPDYKTGDARNCNGSDREIEYYCTWISEEGLLEKKLEEELKND